MNNSELNNYVDKVVERLEEFEKRQSHQLFKNLKIKDDTILFHELLLDLESFS